MRAWLRSALLLPMLVWAGCCLAGAGGLAWALLELRAARVEDAFLRAEAGAAMAEQAVLRAFEVIASQHELLEILHRTGPGASLPLEEHLRRLAETGRFGLVQLGLVGLDGRIAWSSAPDAVGLPVGDREHIRAHLDGNRDGVFVSAPVVGRATGRWGVQVTRTIHDAAGGKAAIASVSLDPVVLSNALAPLVQGFGRRIVLRRLADGAILARSADPETHIARAAAPDHPVVLAARAAPSGRVEYPSTLFDRPLLAAYRVPEGIPVEVAAVLDREDELRGVQRLTALAGFAGVIAMAVGFHLARLWGARREAHRALRAQAECDPLTGLRNRRALQATAQRLAETAGRTGECFTLLLFDLDHFKRINDGFGHEAGDAVLRDVGAALRGNVRAGDVVCRWGGEELVVLLRRCGKPDALRRAEELRTVVETLYAGGRGPVPGVTTSIGAASFPLDGTGLDALVQAADAALYAAKRAGRNRVVLATAG